MGIKEEDVLVLMDATVFGGAKEGLILTNEGIRIKELMVSPIDWQWKDVRDLEVRGTALRINGHQVADNTMVDKPEMQRLFAVVQEFLRQLSGPVAGSPDAHAPRFSQSETPWNDPAQCQVLYVAAKAHLLELSKLLEPVEQEVERNGSIAKRSQSSSNCLVRRSAIPGRRAWHTDGFWRWGGCAKPRSHP